MTETYVFRTYLHRVYISAIVARRNLLWLCGQASALSTIRYIPCNGIPTQNYIEIYYRSRGHQPNIQSIQSIQSNV
jgi:hypothetical protein